MNPIQHQSDETTFVLVPQLRVENTDVSLAQEPGKEEPVVKKINENEELDLKDTTIIGPPPMKYIYRIDQWSPFNKNGKKIYDREFLIKLQGAPNSKIKPINVPNLECVFKDNSKKKNNRGAMDLRQFKDVNLGRHDSLLFPGFVKSSQSARGPLTPKRGSQQGKPKSNKPAVIVVTGSKTKDVESREGDIAWKPFPLISGNISETGITTEALFHRVRELLIVLMPYNLDILIDQLRTLEIDSQEKLQSIVDLIFEEAISKPNFTAAYARICKELAMLHVRLPDDEGSTDESDVNFTKLLITRCVMNFEEAVNEIARVIQNWENEAMADPSKEFQQTSTEEERRNRTKSFGNIRFIAELFKQEILTTFIMHRCIRHLLAQIDDESLECLCKLLVTVGKQLESKKQNLDPYFERMAEIADCKLDSQVSPRIRSMLRDVIELKTNEWIPKSSVSSIETKGQIKKEPETERLYKGRPSEESASNQMVKIQPTHAIDTSKLRNQDPPLDNLQLSDNNVSVDDPKNVIPNKSAPLDDIPNKQVKCSGLSLSESISTGSINCDNVDNIPSSGSSSTVGKPPLSSTSKKRLARKSATILDDYLSDLSMDTATVKVRETFDDSTFANFVREALSKVVNRSASAREQVSRLMTHLISTNILPTALYLSSVGDILNASGDVVINVSKIWVSLAELIWYPLAEGVHPFSELKTTLRPLKKKGLAGTLMGELMIVLLRERGPEWIKEKWDHSGLEWSDFLQENESLNDFVKKYKLEFMSDNGNGSVSNLSEQPSVDEIHKQLLSLMFNEKENSFDNICSWISTNVGDKVSEPEFIKVLMTAILEVSIETYHQTWRFRVERFQNLQVLIPRYIDFNINLTELQCLLAIQEYKHQLENPQRMILQILEKQIFESILSFDVFHAWESNKDTKPLSAKSVAMLAVKSFFTSLTETNAESVLDTTSGQILR